MNGLVFFAPVALLVRTQAGVSEHVFFILQALLSGVIFLGEIPTGFITDKIGYRKSLILAQMLLLWREKFIARSLCEPVTCTVRRGGSCGGIAACFTSGQEAHTVQSVWGKRISCKNSTCRKFRNSRFLSSVQLRMPGFYKISGMEGLLITTVVMDIIAVVCSFYLRSESSKTIIADGFRKEVQILAIFKNKKQKSISVCDFAGDFQYRMASDQLLLCGKT